MKKQEIVETKKICILVGISLFITIGGYAAFGRKTYDNMETTRIEYDKDDNGNIIVNGEISYEELTTKYMLFKIEDLNGKTRFIIGYYKLLPFNDEIINIENGKNFYYGDSHINIIDNYCLNDWLFTLDEVKEEYNIDDINRILTKVEESYENYDVKKLENKSENN